MSEERISKEEIRKAATMMLNNFVEGQKTEEYKKVIDSVDNLEGMSDEEFDKLLNERSQVLDDIELSEFKRIRDKKYSDDNALSYRESILLDLQSMISSHNSRTYHKAKLSDVNLHLAENVTEKSFEQLEAIEILFLYKINGKDVTLNYVPGYFTYKYKLNYQETLNKLFIQKYLTLADIAYTLKKCTTTQLKEILNSKSLSTKGKKQNLIDNILNNYSIEEINEFQLNSYFLVTDKGRELLNQHEALILYYNAFSNSSWTSPDEIIAIELLYPNLSDVEILLIIMNNYISNNPQSINEISISNDLNRLHMMKGD